MPCPLQSRINKRGFYKQHCIAIFPLQGPECETFIMTRPHDDPVRQISWFPFYGWWIQGLARTIRMAKVENEDWFFFAFLTLNCEKFLIYEKFEKIIQWIPQIYYLDAKIHILLYLHHHITRG